MAFGVDPEAYSLSNGYILEEQSKPPDFVLEIASRSTGDEDTGPKRADYEALGVAEYWRFDETWEYHKTKLAGDRLVNGRYEPIAIEKTTDGTLQGYSAALNIHLRWEQGRLAWHDPTTGRHIATFEGERARADAEREARIEEMEARTIAGAERNAAEARIRELEEENRRLRGG